jgi:soluble lytic murein transglycosylase
MLVFMFFFSSCGTRAESVLNITVQEARKHLMTGSIDFILKAKPEKMGEIARIHSSAPFYAGLLVKTEEDAPKLRTIALFTAALSSPSKQVQEAAALELIDFIHDDPSHAADILAMTSSLEPSMLKAAVLYGTGDLIGARDAASGEHPWDRALYLLSSVKTGGAVSQELFQFLLTETIAKAHIWAYRELAAWQESISDSQMEANYAAVLSQTEIGALEGHFATAARSYWKALTTFRTVIERNHTLFFKNPVLIADVGRCFQYSGAGTEGVKLFLEWDSWIQERVHTRKEREETARARYNLLFFAGRMERQQSHWSEAAEYFIRSLVFAPDEVQEDACMWYILDVTLKQSPDNVIPLLHSYAKQWHDASYFSDILGELCQIAVANHNWTRLLEIFSSIRTMRGVRYADGETIAKYAYVIGRIISEGYIPAVKAAAYTGLDSDVSFFRLAYEERTASFYYRTLSASYLGEHVFIEDPHENPETLADIKKEKKSPKSGKDAGRDQADTMDFLLGFFEYGASRYAFPSIQQLAKTLTLYESRILAQALSDNGQYYESIRFISSYMNTEAYSLTLFDMSLYYPRPFYDIIRKYAEQADINEAVLFGLIRTESAFGKSAISSAGAEGLAQIMDFTGKEMAERIRREGGPNYLESGLNLKDPDVNVHIGSYYLAYLIGRTDTILSALLGYNGGPNRIRRLRALETLLPDDLFLETIGITETREYGKRVAAAAAAYGYLYYNLKMEDVLADIFEKRHL